MRFKAKLCSEQVSLLYNLIDPMSRLGGAVSSIDSHPSVGQNSSSVGGGTILFLDSNFMRISSRGKSTSDTDGISCFAELSTGATGIFLEHRIESAAPDNVIVMEIDLVQLRTGLHSIVSSNRGSFSEEGGYGGNMQATIPEYNSVVLKLAKRNGLPCLCIDAYTRIGAVQVHYAIPVRVMRPSEAQYHLPPTINLPDVQLQLPVDRLLRTVAEGFRSINSHVYLDASMSGDLNLRIDSDGASISTFINKLNPMPDDCREGSTGKCTVKLDTKKLCASLQWQSNSMRPFVSSALLCLMDNEMLVIHVIMNPSQVGFLTYYVPVHFMSDAEKDMA